MLQKLIMKKILRLIFSLIILITQNANTFGQGHVPPIVAVFNGNKGDLDKEIASKTINFTLKNVDESSRTDFENRSKKYSSFFTLYYPHIRKNETSQEYVLTLLGKSEFKMLNRLFAAANIKQIEFNGKTMDKEEFFQPYMK